MARLTNISAPLVYNNDPDILNKIKLQTCEIENLKIKN